MRKNIVKQTNPGFAKGSSEASLLTKKGVVIPDPSAVFIDADVVLDRIAPGTVIHPFSRISGSKISLGPGCVLGAEAPVTIANCQLGSQVKLNGGYFSGATFLDNSSMGSCAHVRPGTLLEEFASGAHAVGLKQTVLFPYVVLGSLINFCDCLMAGGTSRQNHGEVGSAYIHFNYTPHQDKATPSLLGDVPRGVLMDQPPIFLGGQGGLVGPARVTYGVIAPAGVIIRKDVLNPGLAGGENQTQAAAGGFTAGAYRSVDRIIRNNLIYIGNIYALQAWYRHVRAQFMTKEKFQAACLAGALERLESIAAERLDRLDELAQKMPRSIELHQKSGQGAAPYLREQKAFARGWEKMKAAILKAAAFEGASLKRDHFLAEISSLNKRQKYLESIPLLTPESKSDAVTWLQSIVDRVAGIWKNELKNGVF